MHTLLTQKFCLMCNMQGLYLQNNQIGDTGMISLADALGKGALARDAQIFLGSNNATEIGKQAMRDAVKARGLSVYL